MRRRLLLKTVLGCAVLLGRGIPARAQETQEPETQQDEVSNLGEIVRDIHWDPEERGPLLIVDPDSTERYSPPYHEDENGEAAQDPRPPLPPKGRSGYALAGLEIPFDLRLIACGTLSVFAPTTMTTLVTRLPNPNIYAEMEGGERLMVFRATLTPAQWRKMSSAEGIGLEDLDTRQRPLFLAILPDPLRVDRVVGAVDRDRTPNSDDPAPPEDTRQPLPVSPAQRMGARISLRRRLTWEFVAGKSTQGYGMADELPSRVAKLSLNTTAGSSSSGPEVPRVFGAALTETARARLKPGDLPFDWNGLDPRITLTGAATVGDLVARARVATRVEIHCDLRYARLPVYLRGTSARTGDVLKALCHAVTGTFRHLGSAYVLTDDREGLGTRHARIQYWFLNGLQAMQEMGYLVRKAMYDQPTADLVWDDSATFSPDATIQTRLADLKKRQATLKGGWDNLENWYLIVPVSDLPPVMGEFVRQQIASAQKERPVPDGVTGVTVEDRRNRPEPIRTDVIALNSTERFVVVVPGIGTVDASDLDSPGNFFFNRYDPPAAKGKTRLNSGPDWSNREVIVAPESAAEAERAVWEAKRLGCTAVWLAVRPGGVALVSAGVAAGKEIGIPVGAVVRMLRSGGAGNLPLDLNVFGETSPQVAARVAADPLTHSTRLDLDSTWGGAEPTVAARQDADALVAREKRWGGWLRADLPEVRAAQLARVKAIARVPGLAGLVLRNLVEPGSEGGQAAHGEWNGLTMLGYHADTRLAFLRKYGADPVDLSPLVGGELNAGFQLTRSVWGMRLPFFPDSVSADPDVAEKGNASEANGVDVKWKWLEWRVNTAHAFIEAFVRDVRKAAPGVPVLYFTSPLEGLKYAVPRISLLKPGDAGIRPLLPPLPAPESPLTPEEAETWRAERDNPRFTANLARRGFQRVTQVLSYQPDGDANQNASLVAQLESARARSGDGWDGLAFDLTEVSVDTAFALLDAVRLAAPVTTPP